MDLTAIARLAYEESLKRALKSHGSVILAADHPWEKQSQELRDDWIAVVQLIKDELAKAKHADES